MNLHSVVTLTSLKLESYKKLCDKLDIPILAAECSDGSHWNAAEFIRRDACDIMRTSTHYKGGFTGGMKVGHVAEAFGMKAEVHGGGHNNLHLCLALPNNTYYEDLVIDVEDIEAKGKGQLKFENGVEVKIMQPSNNDGSVPGGWTNGWGFSIDMQGDTVVIGARSNSNTDLGYNRKSFPIYVFGKDYYPHPIQSPPSRLFYENSANEHQFGLDLSIYENEIAIYILSIFFNEIAFDKYLCE